MPDLDIENLDLNSLSQSGGDDKSICSKMADAMNEPNEEAHEDEDSKSAADHGSEALEHGAKAAEHGAEALQDGAEFAEAAGRLQAGDPTAVFQALKSGSDLKEDLQNAASEALKGFSKAKSAAQESEDPAHEADEKFGKGMDPKMMLSMAGGG